MALGGRPAFVRGTRSLESVRRQARTVADTYNLGRLSESGEGDSAVLRRAQWGKTVFRVADESRNQRRLKLDPHVPGHRQAGDAAFGVVVSRTSGPGPEKLAGLRQRQVFESIGYTSTWSPRE